MRRSSPRADTPIQVTAHRQEDEVVVSVTDQGIGIAPEDLPHLFDRFYRVGHISRAEGTGLGLYIAKRLVEAHGGRIWVESEVGKGSTFSSHCRWPVRIRNRARARNRYRKPAVQLVVSITSTSTITNWKRGAGRLPLRQLMSSYSRQTGGHAIRYNVTLTEHSVCGRDSFFAYPLVISGFPGTEKEFSHWTANQIMFNIYG